MTTLARRIFVSLLLAALALPLAAQQPGGRMVSFGSDTGYLAVPKTPGKHPAVVVIQEWFGLNTWLKQQADKLAAQGYVALAPDLYHGKVATNSQQAMALVRAFDRARGMRDLNAAYAYLGGRADVEPNRIAAMGWCFGGGLSWSFADQQPGLRGVVIFYGPLPAPADRARFIANMHVPVLGNFGGADRSIPAADVLKFAAALKAAGRSINVKVYPGMPHAFAHQTTPAGIKAYANAWGRALTFLHQRLD